MNSLSKRESLANIPEEKVVFFDGWTPTNMAEIANMRSCGKFTHVHEIAIHPEMRKILDAIVDKKSRHVGYCQNAVSLLGKACQNCFGSILKI